jgi:superfamily II DNA or RNA helicase
LDKYKFILDRKIISDKKRNSLIVDDIALYNDHFTTVVLTRSVDHMEALKQELYAKYKIDACMIHSKQNAKINLAEKEIFESRQKRIMFATFNMLKKGYDNIYINRLIFAFPISSKEWVVQSVGRATRAAPGKKGALVLDYLDDCEMLKAQAGIRERVYREEGLHVTTKTEKEYLNADDKSWLFGEDDQQR